jgi:hypothetical protein
MAASGAPHSPQNFCPVGFSAAQFEHVVTLEEPNRHISSWDDGPLGLAISSCGRLPRAHAFFGPRGSCTSRSNVGTT